MSVSKVHLPFFKEIKSAHSYFWRKKKQTIFLHNLKAFQNLINKKKSFYFFVWNSSNACCKILFDLCSHFSY